MGTIITFYSFKGGVGRTMALANIAVLLAERGLRVLAIDWDLEAPGLERYFQDLETRSPERPGGLIALLREAFSGPEEHQQNDWRKFISSVALPSGKSLSLLLSGERAPGQSETRYSRQVLDFDWQAFFTERNGGHFIEAFRTDAKAEFDFVLIDSRTGITDSNGVCTIQLPDILALMFTANSQSLEGAIDVARLAEEGRQKLAFDRMPLSVFPIPSRFDARTEFEEARKWLGVFAKELKPFYDVWLPSSLRPLQALERTRIPYVPFFSFGEKLPALSHGTSDPEGLGYAYNVLTQVLASDFKNVPELLQSEVLPMRYWDTEWLDAQRTAALRGLRAAGQTGYFRLEFALPEPKPKKRQTDLAVATRAAEIKTFGWPIAPVFDKEEYKPRPRADGIYAEVAIPDRSSFDYWALRTNGDFFLLASLFEDTRIPESIFFNTRIVRVAESLLYCEGLYSALGIPVSTKVSLRIAHGGLKGRVLRSSSPNRDLSYDRRTTEDYVEGDLTVSLDEIRPQLADHVQRLLTPLFTVFDFFELQASIYKQIIDKFVAGEVT